MSDIDCVKSTMPRPSGDIWLHYHVLSEEGSKKHAACNYCGFSYKYANAQRMRDHLLKCVSCPTDAKKIYGKASYKVSNKVSKKI